MTDREDRAALELPSSLAKTIPAPRPPQELLCLNHAVLPCGGVQDQQGSVAPTLHVGDHPPDLLQLRHQVIKVCNRPAVSTISIQVGVVCLGIADSIKGDGTGVAAFQA